MRWVLEGGALHGEYFWTTRFPYRRRSVFTAEPCVRVLVQLPRKTEEAADLDATREPPPSFGSLCLSHPPGGVILVLPRPSNINPIAPSMAPY